MIKARTLMVMVGITAAVVIGALVSSRMRTPAAPESAQVLVLPGLAGRINDVASIKVATADGRKIDLERTPDGWVDASRGGYPARFEPIKQILIAFSEAKIGEHKTSDPENYQRLGVSDPHEEGAHSTLITFGDASGSPIASLIIGERMSGAAGRFVRLPDQSEVLLTVEDVNASPAPLNWLEREVIRVPRDQVERVAIARPDGDSFTVFRKDDGTFDMLGVPEGRRLRGQSPMAGIVGALAFVDFLDVKPAADIDFDALPTPLLASYETNDGMIVDVSIWKDEEMKKKWTTLAVSKADRASASGASASEGDAESLDERLAALKGKLDGWAYEISPSSLVPLETSMLELTQQIPSGEPQAGPQAPPAPQAPRGSDPD